MRTLLFVNSCRNRDLLVFQNRNRTSSKLFWAFEITSLNRNYFCLCCVLNREKRRYRVVLRCRRKGLCYVNSLRNFDVLRFFMNPPPLFNATSMNFPEPPNKFYNTYSVIYQVLSKSWLTHFPEPKQNKCSNWFWVFEITTLDRNNHCMCSVLNKEKLKKKGHLVI